MEKFFDMALKRRWKGKIWGKLFMWWAKRQNQKFIKSLKIDINDVTFTETYDKN